MIRDLITESTSVSITMTEAQLEAYSINLIKRVLDQRNEKVNNEEIYLTRDEVSLKLGVSKPTLWKWDKQDYLKPVRIGVKVLYKQSDIIKIMEG